MEKEYWLDDRKILGVLGFSPYATYDFVDKVARLSNAKKDWEHIRVIIDLNTKIPSRGRCLDLGEENPSKYIRSSIQGLKNSGARLVAIPCNTAHYFYDQYTEMAEIPVLHIIDETCKYILRTHPEIKKIGLLASNNTCKYRLYESFFDQRNLHIIHPKKQDEVAKLIEEVKVNGKNSRSTRTAQRLIDEFKEYGAECVILGCTEIPIAIEGSNNDLILIDSNQILATESIEQIKSLK